MNKDIKLNWKTIQKGITQVAEWKACSIAIKELKQIKTLDEFLAHENAPFWLCWYVQQLKKGRVISVEAIIAKNVYFTYLYCKNIAGFRIPSMEANIKKDNYYWNEYLKLPKKEVTQ